MSLPAAALPEDLDLTELLEALFRRLRELCPGSTFAVRDGDELTLARRVALAVADPATAGELLLDPVVQAEGAVADLVSATDPEGLLAADRRIESPLVARFLIRKARSFAAHGIKDGVRISTLAIRAARLVNAPLWGRAYVRSLVLQARGSRVEALRATGRLEEAHREAIELLDDLGPCDSPLLRGDVHLLAGRVRRAQGALDDATAFYVLAREAYELAGDARRLGRALLHLADVHREQFEVEVAVEAARRAVTVLRGGTDRDAHVSALHNLAIYLCDAGSPAEARKALEESRDVRGCAGERAVELKSLWVEGRIHEQSGDLELAERLYREALEALAALPLGAEAAAVCVDLIGVLVARRRFGEAFEASSRLGVLFRRHSCPRPALFALLAFREAVRATPPDRDQLRSCLESLRGLLRSVSGS